MSIQFKSAALALLIGLRLALPALAAPLPPGTVLFGPSTEADPVGGTSITSLSSPFTVPGAFSGTLTSEVFSGDTSNPLGGLTFVYTITNDGAAGPNSIGRLSLSEFAGIVVDANYQIPVPAGAVAPASVDRNPAGDVIGFNFVPVGTDPATGFLAPGGASAALVLQTGVTSLTGYRSGAYASVIDGGVGTVDAIVPVPEPATLALGLISLAGAGLLIRGRR